MRRVARLLLLALLCVESVACERGDAAEGPADHVAQAEPASEGVTTGANFTIVHHAVSVTVDEPSEIELQVTPSVGWKVNVEYPWELTLETSGPVALSQTALDGPAPAQLTEEEAVYEVPLTVSEAGAHRVVGHLRFSICNEARCDLLQADVAWVVSAE